MVDHYSGESRVAKHDREQNIIWMKLKMALNKKSAIYLTNSA